MDELAAAAHKDPVEFRRALLGKSPRARAVLDLATEKASWGSSLRGGQGRGVSLQYVWDSYMCVVMDVEITSEGAARVRRVVCAADCGVTVDPDQATAHI